MNFKGHLVTISAILIVFGLIAFNYIRSLALIPIVYFSIIIGVMLPDGDHKIKKGFHRWGIVHSIILPFIGILLSYGYPMLMLLFIFISLGMGSHCLGDIRFKKSKMVGYYTVKLWGVYNPFTKKWKVYGLNGVKSTIWYIGNFVASVVIFLLYLIFI